MKIIKTKNLTESVFNEADEEKVTNIEDVLNDAPAQETVDLKDASKDEIKNDIIQGVVDRSGEINISKEDAARLTKEAEKDAKIVKMYSDIIYNPYGTARPEKIKRCLQRSLEQALRQKRQGIIGNYPNVLIYGLAGFGKTSIIEEFCEEHNIYLFECDAKNLDAATVGGIPYPIEDPDTGETTQMPISSAYWDDLNEPCILFLDEINRATGRVRGSLLSLINNHILPASKKDATTGKRKPVKFYPNILFTIIAVNPADETELDVAPLDPPMVSRMAAILNQEGSNREFKDFFDRYADNVISGNYIAPKKAKAQVDQLYQSILSNPDLAADDVNRMKGQKDLADAIMVDSNFHWDDAETCKKIFALQTDNGIMKNYLNYRSFMLAIVRSNGTKADFLDVIREDSNYIDKDVEMIENILANYKDKITVGNNLFTHSKTDRQEKAAIDAEDDLGAFINGLNP